MNQRKMFRVNKHFYWVAILFIATLLFSFSDSRISPRLQKKIDTAILATFQLDTFMLRHLPIETKINDAAPAPLGGTNLFEIHSAKEKIGYLYLGEAPSMKRKFDYIIMFNPDLSIKKSKVLIYREDYGRQIGSQRWLKQFVGLSSNDVPSYGENIDAISGATISASSLTKAVADVLKSIDILRKKQILK